MDESITYCLNGHCSEPVADNKLCCSTCFYSFNIKHQDKIRKACTALKTGKGMNEEISELAKELYEYTNGNAALAERPRELSAIVTRYVLSYVPPEPELDTILGYGEALEDIKCLLSDSIIPKGCHVVITGRYKSNINNILTDMMTIRKAYDHDSDVNIKQFGNEVVWFQKPKETTDLNEVKEIGLVIVDDNGWLDYGDIVYKDGDDDMVRKLKDPTGRMNYQEGQIVWLKDPCKKALMTEEMMQAIKDHCRGFIADDSESKKRLIELGVIPHGN